MQILKSLTLVLVVTLSGIATAEVLLDCSLPGGDTQGATVVRDSSGKLKLLEVTSRGQRIERSLYRLEWKKKKFRLHTEYSDARSYLYLDSGDWMFEYRSNGFNIFSEAQCD